MTIAIPNAYDEIIDFIATENKAELDRYMVLENLLRLAKAHAHQHLVIA
jgi:hypothetical protein